jgi:hypothetical protein
MQKKKEYKIPPHGSLGLLALGDIGLKQWREVRKKAGKDPVERKVEKKEENTDTDGDKKGE